MTAEASAPSRPPPPGAVTSVDGTHVELRRIDKRFGGAHALRGVSLDIPRGAVHALVGENGAGKSTLGRVVAGAVRPDSGDMSVCGRQVLLRSPRDALAQRITLIAQELALLPARSVLDNVFLGYEPKAGAGRVSVAKAARRYEELAAWVGFDVPRRALVRELRLADRQKVEILRALARDAELIVFDEPTAALDAEDTKVLLRTVRRLADAGTTVVFVSHFLKEVLAVSDLVTVLKDGVIVATAPARRHSERSLVTAMLGRSPDEAFPSRQVRRSDAPMVLEASNLTTAAGVRDVSVRVARGEIVGVAGLVGSGRSELLRALYGADPLTAGTIRLSGRTVALRHPRDAIRVGVAMLPESRKDDGLLMMRSVRDNTTLSQLRHYATAGVLRAKMERREARDVFDRLSIAAPGVETPVAALSGGNQQKVMFARCLLRPGRLLLADEPTRGVDVGAKRAIYRLLVELAASGMGVLFVSSEIEEILGLSDRVLVLRSGAVASELEGKAISEEAVMRAAFTASPAEEAGP